MIRELVNRMVAGAVAAGAALVAIAALGATVYFALCLVLVPLAAAAITAGLFALIALTAFFVLNGRSNDDQGDDVDDEPESLPSRLMSLVQERPVLGVVAALAAGAVLLKKPGLAALAVTAFSEGTRGSRDYRDSRSSSKRRRR